MAEAAEPYGSTIPDELQAVDRFSQSLGDVDRQVFLMYLDDLSYAVDRQQHPAPVETDWNLIRIRSAFWRHKRKR